MTTPEGRVKQKIKKLLKHYPHYGWWPVPAGYGENSLDYVGCIGGEFFAIEVKASGGTLTPLQQNTKRRIQHAGGRVFVIHGYDDRMISLLEDYLASRSCKFQT